MKAIVSARYGRPEEVLAIKEVDIPTLKDNQVLVKVRAASVNPADWHLLEGKPLLARFMGGGLLRPKTNRPGSDIGGTVEAVGGSVKQFQSGDEVFGSCSGGFAEYACAREDYLVLKPSNLSFEEAASVPVAAITALQGLRDKGQIQAGQKVLINGASGGVGAFAVQIAKFFGTEVTGVCSTGNLAMVRSIGADHVIDYTTEDFTKKEQRYDLILGIAGYHSIFSYRRALSPNGIYVFIGASHHLFRALLEAMLLGSLISKTGSKRIASFIAKINKKDLEFLKHLLEIGKVKPVIDRCYSLNEVPKALRYLEEGHAKGKVVITI